MADPLKVLRSLDRLADQYTVFEPDQVLTHSQLNSLSAYLDDQDRLTRVALLGVGLVGGLRVGRQGGAVRVTRGLGVTTDGDLLMLGADTLYDRWRPYDTTAPVYEPFYRGRPAPRPDAPTETATETALAPAGEMIELQELVPVGESDVLALPLSSLPGSGLDDKVVLMLMESVVNDPDLCSGTDCDNLGRDALHRVRMLLIGRGDAAALMRSLPALAPASERAQALPELALDRPALGRDIATTGALAARYRTAARAALERFIDALRSLQAAFPELLDELFGADPSAGWVGVLRAQAAAFERRDQGLQPWYAFVGDLVETWNGLREALLADDGVMLPDVQAFPKSTCCWARWPPRATPAPACTPRRGMPRRAKRPRTRASWPGSCTCWCSPSGRPRTPRCA